MPRYAIDHASSWRDDGKNLTADDFLAEGIDDMVTIDAESPAKAANIAADDPWMRVNPGDTLLVFNIEAQTLHRMTQVTKWVEG